MVDRSREWDIEWEPAARKFVLDNINFPAPFISGVKKVTIQRNDELILQLTAEGRLESHEEYLRTLLTEQQREAGAFMDAAEVEFDAHRSRFRLRAHMDESPSQISFVGENPGRFTQRGLGVHFRRRWQNKLDFSDESRSPVVDLGPETWRADWFINGPHAPYGRYTTRRGKRAFTRERSETEISINEPPTGGHSLDHHFVEVEGIRFSINAVPKEFAPIWCYPASLEFKDPVPGEGTRQAVAEIVSFVVGRRLIPLGSTSFDAQGGVIEEEARDPWGQNIRRECEVPDMPPIPTEPFSRDIENVLTELVPRYLAVRTSLGLRDSLLTYWLANEAISGVNLALYGSAVEGLKVRWFKSAKRKRVHVEQAEFAKGVVP